MNYRLIIVMMALALCMCLPVSAVWNNGNWISEQDSVNVQYDSVTGVSSKIVPTDTSVPTDHMGELNIQTLTYHAIIGSTFTIQKVSTKNKTFVNGDRIAKDVYDSYITLADPHIFDLDHNGRFNDRVLPGVYRICLNDGNGGQPEYAIAEVIELQKTDVVFLGHGVSADVSGPHNVVFTIIEATYGATQCDQVIDVPAHTEYRYWIEATGHWEGHGWNKHWVVDSQAHWSEWSNTNPHNCYYEHRHIADTYKTVCSGETIDVTQNVQSVVNQGVTSFFFFDNAQNPGGIFSETNALLSQIDDPAPGLVKNVYIHYTRDGEDQTINTQEYLKINL